MEAAELAVGGGVGLVLSRAAGTSPVWYFPYALLWLWVILSVRLVRRAGTASTVSG